MTKKEQKKAIGAVALLGLGYLAYRWLSPATPWTNAKGDAPTMNTNPLNSLPGLPSMQGLGGCGCKRRV